MFLKQVNDVFDMLNVRGFGTKAAAPLKLGCQQQLERLMKLKADALAWKVLGRNRPPCFDGLVQDINAVLAIHDDLVVNGPLSFPLTGRFNQDCIENLSQIRAKGGNRFNPSAKEFRFAYRSICSMLILSGIPSANCSFDDDVMLSSLARLSSEACSAAHTARAEKREQPLKKQRLDEEQMVLSANDFITYIGGYTVRKIQESIGFTCEICLPVLLQDTDRMDVVEDGQLYVHLKAYSHVKGAFGSLNVPSSALTHRWKTCLARRFNYFWPAAACCKIFPNTCWIMFRYAL